jgi:hypothetical protein
VHVTGCTRRVPKLGVVVDVEGVLRVAWLAAEQHLQHDLVSRTDVLGLTGSCLSRNEEALEHSYPARPRSEGGVVGRRRREGVARHRLGEQNRSPTLRLACTANMVSKENKEAEDRTSRVLGVEKGTAVGMMVVGRRGPRLCGNSEQESEGQGSSAAPTPPQPVSSPDIKAKRQRMQSASTR